MKNFSVKWMLVAGLFLSSQAFAIEQVSVVDSNQIQAVPRYEEVKKSDLDLMTRQLAVFGDIEGSEQIVSLSEQDKALTGAAYATYYPLSFGRFIPNARLSLFYVPNCKFSTLMFAKATNLLSKAFTGVCY